MLDEARKMIGVETVKMQPAKRPGTRPEVRRQLAVIAAEEGKTQQQLVAEALNLLFKVYQKPPIA